MTANAQLKLLSDSLTPVAVAVNIGTPAGNLGAPTAGGSNLPAGYLNNQVVTALNKIVYNTYAIASNTAYKLDKNAFDGTLQHGHSGIGVYATGGVIPPYGLGLVSEHSPGGGRFIQAGADPITVSPFAPQPTPAPITNVVNFPRGGGGNSNAELIAEVKALKEEVKKLREENTKVTIGTSNLSNRAIAEQTEELGGKFEEAGKRVAYEIRQQERKQR